MAKSDANYQNFKKYYDGLKARGYDNLPIPDHEQTIEELAKEGFKLLSEEKSAPKAPTPDDTKKLQKKLAEMSDNPYLRARMRILLDLPEEKRKVIEQMEKTGNINGPTYKEFLKMVTILGDKFSNEKKKS